MTIFLLYLLGFFGTLALFNIVNVLFETQPTKKDDFLPYHIVSAVVSLLCPFFFPILLAIITSHTIHQVTKKVCEK